MTLPQKTKISVALYVMAIITLSLMLLTMMFLKFSINGAAVGKTITLNGPWKFKTGDNQQWAQSDFNDSNWESINLTAPAGAHDGDVGLSGYVPGWAARGYPTYSGYAWYRMKISLDSVKKNSIALAGPPAVDDAYQLFINGVLSGSAGDFSGKVPITYSIQPRMFLLPESTKKENYITIAFRVWMSAATSGQAPDVGGIHIAPELGEKSSVESKYRFQWEQTIKGYIVEIVEPVIFILLAISLFLLFRSQQPPRSCKWFILALVLLAFVRANQAIYCWFQIESAHQYDIVTTILLRPLILGCWLMAWWEWYELRQPKWIPSIIVILTLIYMGTQLLGLPSVSSSMNSTFFQKMADNTRLLFVPLMLFIIYRGFLQQERKEWLVLLAILLVSVGLFAQEFAQLHIIPGIWFPYGVGVSTTQYAYAAFTLVMYIILIQKSRKVFVAVYPER
ncbi:glycoside hydrolase [Chitinophaga polysaccharea]|uniref:glycoside hydrolase n=1 Tax=Chitinophaga polysaccharea TaxID=1293035 RepID=UPI0014555E5D|nr:glycoside hydrolase [Chitinophaga polysaccharea]NLR56840.1 glycoside hydrolase [Chitinophaga polysaccharea]